MVLAGDLDRNGYPDLVIRRNEPYKVMFYELDSCNQWHVKDSLYSTVADYIVWAWGDFDVDGLVDIVLQRSFGVPVFGISVYEAVDSFSYPLQEVWRDTVYPAQVLPMAVCDMDHDGVPEIIKNKVGPIGYLGIYESISNDQYELIFVDNPDTNYAPSSSIALDDFDQDSLVEFVIAGISGQYWIYECTGPNSYEKIAEGALPTGNTTDCCAIQDADQDGKWEFMVKGHIPLATEINVFIFEAVGNNTYDTIQTFTFVESNYWRGYSASGDVDGDGIPELLLEAGQEVYIIKAAGDDSFYVWDSLPGCVGGCVVVLYDFDNNGYNEIIISVNDTTYIYEHDNGAVQEYNVPSVYSWNKCASILIGPFPIPENMNCKIYDITGRKIHTLDPAPGIYFIEVDGEIRQKVIKVR